MPERFSSRDIVKVLESLGFYFRSQKGSHGKYKDDSGKIVIVPMNKKEIPAGTFKNILNQAGISFEKFKQMLNR
jgi:predicted RNA binding protein YcfA (HicA-like mRNA interferase family)